MSNIKFKEATNTIKYEESKQKVDMSSKSEDNHYYNTSVRKSQPCFCENLCFFAGERLCSSGLA